MKNIFNIAWKDFKITYRDFTALMLIIAAPLVMTLVMNFAFGSSSNSFSIIPIAVINNDEGQIGDIFSTMFKSDELLEFLQPIYYETLEKAQVDMDNDKIAAIIVIPKGLSTPLSFQKTGTPEAFTFEPIDLYTNPLRPVSAEIVESIMNSILVDLNVGFIGGTLGFSHLLEENLVTLDQLADGLGEEYAQKIEPIFSDQETKVDLQVETLENKNSFSWVSYMAPSMAILFLSFSMNSSSKSILGEREHGTLPRLLISPNRPVVILSGKLLGTFMIGLVQLFIFIILSRLLLGIDWGPFPQLFVFTASIVLAVASWGILIASIARNSGEASAVGTAILLIFAALSGTFIPRGNFPAWLRTLGYITPNAWGIEGYFDIINGAGWSAIWPSIIALSLMSVAIMGIASLFFHRQFHSAT